MDDSYSWDLPIIFVGIVFCIGLFGVICQCCYKHYSDNSWSSSESPTQVPTSIPTSQPPSRPPNFVQAMRSAPPPTQSEDPPPYSEVALKPNNWPLVDQLPSYDNVAMDDLPSQYLPSWHGRVSGHATTKC